MKMTKYWSVLSCRVLKSFTWYIYKWKDVCTVETVSSWIYNGRMVLQKIFYEALKINFLKKTYSKNFFAVIRVNYNQLEVLTEISIEAGKRVQYN